MSGDRILPPTRRGFLASTGALALAGCSGNLIGPPPAPQLYVLHPDFTPLPAAPAVPWQLIVAVPVAPESFDTERIALTRAPNIMDYYANAQWTDRAPLLLQGLLVEAFEKSGKITAAREATGIRGDYILASEIHDFEAFYSVIDTPPKVEVHLSVSLLGALRHDVLATLQAQHEAQAAANDLPSVTAAFAQATGAAVEEIVNWTLHTPLAGADQAAAVSAPAAQPLPRRRRRHHNR